MSTHNIGFYEDLTKIIFQLPSNIIKYAHYLFFCTLLILNNQCPKFSQVKAHFLYDFFAGGLSVSNLDFLQNLDSLKESVRLAGTGGYDWQNIDISQFQGTRCFKSIYFAINIFMRNCREDLHSDMLYIVLAFIVQFCSSRE